MSQPPEWGGPWAPPPLLPADRTEPAKAEYIPEGRRPIYNQHKRDPAYFAAQATRHEVGPGPYQVMVDLVLEATGKTSLAHTTSVRGSEALNQAKETIITLLEMKRHTVEDVQAILSSWHKNDWRGKSPPTFGQIVEHASAMDAGTHVTLRETQASQQANHKLRHRAANAQTLLQTARQFGWSIDPQWQKDIDAAQGLCLL